MLKLVGVILAVVIVVAQGVTDGQPTTKVYRLGILGSSGGARVRVWLDAFLQGMREHGWIENQNFVMESLYTRELKETARSLAVQLIQHGVDVIVVTSTEAALGAQQATRRVPIVMANPGDPIATGLVSTLAHPGGNITGMSFVGTELVGKQLDLLKDALPQVSRIAVFANPTNASHSPRLREVQAAARGLKIEVEAVEVGTPRALDTAFARIKLKGIGAVLVLADPLLDSESPRISSFCFANRLPAIYGLKEEVMTVGGLMSYGPSFTDLFYRTAAYVDKILRGTKPADLPVEQPTKFELVINQRTAKALGVTIPPSLLLRADQVIE